MDIFDEFEFKPLTEGLGFHKKEVLLKDEELRKKDNFKLNNSADPFLATEARNNMEFKTNFEPSLELDFAPAKSKLNEVDELLQKFPSLDAKNKTQASKPNVLVHEPLARTDLKAKATESIESKLADFNLKTESKTSTATEKLDSISPIKPKLNIEDLKRELDVKKKANEAKTSNAKVDFKMDNVEIANPVLAKAPAAALDLKAKVETKSESKTTTTTKLNTQVATAKNLKTARVNFLATALDSIVVFGFINIFIAILLIVTEVDVYTILNKTSSDIVTQFSVALLAFAALELYMVVSRSFFGMSLGEWALDLQLGTKEQQLQASYPIKVAWRSFINLATGLVLLPLLSFIFNRDLAYYVSGLELYERD